MKNLENQTVELDDLDIVYVNVNGELMPLEIKDDVDIDMEGGNNE
jgi:hypothetical protein